MISIDRVLRTVLTLANTDVIGNAKPDEARMLINNSVDEIVEEYFYELNQMISRENTGRISSGIENIPDRIREKILYFLKDRIISKVNGYFALPDDLRYIDTAVVNMDFGPSSSFKSYNDSIIEESKSMKEFNVVSRVNASMEYPIYLITTNGLMVRPNKVDRIRLSYLRKHKIAKWSFVVIRGNEVANPSAPDYQDIDLHPSEESKVVLKTLNKLGINLKEQDLQAVTMNKEAQEFNMKNIG